MRTSVRNNEKHRGSGPRNRPTFVVIRTAAKGCAVATTWAENQAEAAEHRERLEDTKEAVKALKEALRVAGITVPSLCVEIGSFVSNTMLVDLGRCNVATARALAEVIAKGTDA